MRKTLIVLVSVLALVLGFTAVASAAAKPAYKVSLTAPKTSQAGKFVIVSGKVTGPKAAGKTVTLQRRYVGGPWVNVAFPVIKKNGKFSARVETPRGGTTAFRALKAKSTVRKAGASPVVGLPVYEWLYLSHQNGNINFNLMPGNEATIGGKYYGESISVYNDTQAYWKLGKVCTKLTAVADYQYNGSPAPANDVNLNFATTKDNGDPSVPHSKVISTGTPSAITVPLTGTKYLSLNVAGIDSNFTLVVGNPRLYCNADRLPSWANGDF